MLSECQGNYQFRTGNSMKIPVAPKHQESLYEMQKALLHRAYRVKRTPVICSTMHTPTVRSKADNPSPMKYESFRNSIQTELHCPQS
ncbi:hypothetical protein RND71_012552 [Anisodus tanguticus]|uniref:Uncharacterized protein n=1 Tax=Anisodus tanguticus TaxID=243964 RepID=A0AAE1SEV3_9SOLA|nr:hypothetical protein RND71_012552 [Anisodus tanguticus]